MRVAFKPRPRDLSHYPFLKEAQDELYKREINPVNLSKTPNGIRYLDEATNRVIFSIEGKKENIYGDTKDDPVLDIVTFVLAKLLVRCSKDRRTKDRFASMEARRIYKYLTIEIEKGLRDKVCEELGISFASGNLSVLKYVEMSSSLHDDKWRLVNRVVEFGRVVVSPDEHELLIQEKIRAIILESLSANAPDVISEEYKPWTDVILAKVQERTLAEFGAVEESAFPPCIQAIIAGAAAGANLTHSARFALVAFLYSIGMDIVQIEGFFARSPDYNPDMTMYQVNHILSNEYIPPACATMLTHGICVNKDSICGKCIHPLRYYQLKKRALEKKKLIDDAKNKMKNETEEKKDSKEEKSDDKSK